MQTQAARDVLAERERQKVVEGWSIEHDDRNRDRQLALAAASYCGFACAADHVREAQPKNDPPPFWPWSRSWWKPSDRRRDLVKAGALILAEIERLDRAAAHSPETVR